MADNVLDLTDWLDERVIFTKVKWQEKVALHPELRSKVFLENIRKTIADPTDVWPDKSGKEKLCYYRKYSKFSYVKVVIWIKHHPHQIVSAFETNFIKESKYPELRQIK